MGLYNYDSTEIPKSDRIPKLVENLYAKMPEIESARAILITESYRQTENEPMVIRRAKAFAHILENIPIVIRDLELIVGSTTIAPRGCQTYPEFSYEWLEAEFDTVETRSADPFYISEKTKQELKESQCLLERKNDQRTGHFLHGTGDTAGNGTQYLYPWKLFLQWCGTCDRKIRRGACNRIFRNQGKSTGRA